MEVERKGDQLSGSQSQTDQGRQLNLYCHQVVLIMFQAHIDII